MKKFVALLLALLCVISFMACGAKEPEPEEYAFQATVLEVGENFLLLEPGEGTWERSSADQIYAYWKDKTSWPIPQVGDTVNVVHSGEIMETYPAQLTTVYRVEILTDTEN